MDKNFIIIALGSNLGERYQNLKTALLALKTKISNINCSNIYSSKALLPPGSPEEWNHDFYNCVFSGTTELDLRSLFEFSLDVENTALPKKKLKGTYSPRYIDIDIIAFNDEVFESEVLQIPHRRMCERDFVLFPLADILPEWRYPAKGLNFQKTALELAQGLGYNSSNEIKKLNFKVI